VSDFQTPDGGSGPDGMPSQPYSQPPFQDSAQPPSDSPYAAGQPSAFLPSYPVPPAGYQQQGYPAGPYQVGYGQPGYGAPARSNGMAIAAMICGICGFVCGITAVLAVVFGCVSLGQIKQRGDQGRGMAIAGIVLGSVWLLLIIALIASHFAFSAGSAGVSSGS
jgi:Domain of unknown function (DUF4190)